MALGGGGNAPSPPKKPAPGPSVTQTLHQPPFDPRIRNIHNPMGAGTAKFERGFMVWDVTYCAAAGYSPHDPPSVSFLFNPSTVQASYSLSDSTAQAAMIFGVTAGGASSAPYVGLQQSMNFTLMFDRTYEVNSGATSGAGFDAKVNGVEADVRAMKQFTGMFAAATSQSGAYTSALPSGQKPVQATGTGYGPQQGIMLMMPSYCFFGSGQIGGTSQYYGYVGSWNVQYTHFNTFMVPMRCVVDIEYTLLPLATNNFAELSNGAVIALEIAQNQLTL